MRKYIIIIVTFIYFTFSLSLHAQRSRKYYNKVYQDALKDFSIEDYGKALKAFLYLDSIPIEQITKNIKDSKNFVDGKPVPEIKILIKYHIAECYINRKYENTKSIPYFEYVLKSKYNRVPESIYNELGTMYHYNYQFERAKRCFEKYIQLYDEKYIESSNIKDKNYEYAKRMLNICKGAESLYSDSVKVNIQNIGYPINTDNSETNPFISADESNLFFNRTTYSVKNNLPDSEEIIMLSHKQEGEWQTPKQISFSQPVNNKLALLAGLSPDGEQLFLAVKEDGKTNIYTCHRSDDRCEDLKKLNNTINSGYNQGKVSITADGTEIYFSSDRPGGFGGMDIYKAFKDDNGDWVNAVNLGPVINTAYDEDAPFIHPDKKTLYFCSKGHNVIGGFDIFKCTLQSDKTWSLPVNLGYPINTTKSEIDFSLSASGLTGYYSRVQHNKAGTRDIYSFTLNQDIPLTLLKGTILAGDPLKPVAAKIKVIDKETNTRVKYIYDPNPKTGKYLMIFPPGKDYDIVIESKDYMPQLINVHIPNQTYFYELFQEIHLKPLNLLDKKLGEEISVSNTFVDVYGTPSGENVISKTGKKDYGKLLNLIEDLINTTDSVGLEKIDFAYDKIYKEDEIKNDSTYRKDIGNLLNFIDNAIETTDSVTLFLLDKNTIYRKDYSQKYFYSEENAKDLHPIILGKDTIYTAPPLNTKEHDISSRGDSAIAKIIPESTKKDIRNIKPEEKKIILTYNVYFATGQYKIEPKYIKDMGDIVSLLKNNSNLYIEIYGYSDSRGGEEENLELSKSRANAVLGYFNDAGINTETAIVRSFGKTMSYDEKTDKDRQRNRRVDVKIFEYIKPGK